MEVGSNISVDELLHDILKAVDDEDLKKGFERGWYVSQIQQAIEDIGFATFYKVVTRDLDMDKTNFAVQLPPNAFNIREIYLFNGACCDPSDSVIVHWKRLHNNKGLGPNFTSKTRDDHNNHHDPFFGHKHHFHHRHSHADSTPGDRRSHLHYANVYNGLIMFSNNADSFDKVRLVYNGIEGDIGTEPVIPRNFRQFVKDYVKVEFFGAMKVREPSMRIHWADARNDLNDPRNGSKKEAKLFVKRADRWKKEDQGEYLGRMNF